MSITISISIGFGSNSFLQNARSARVAIELTLRRSSDQVVIKTAITPNISAEK